MKCNQLSTLPFGVLLFAIALLIERFLPENNVFDFIAGFLIGFSIVINLGSFFKHLKKTLSF